MGSASGKERPNAHLTETRPHVGRPRLVDYDEARRRYKAGERVADLAAEYGVSLNAIYRAVNPAYGRRQDAGARARIEQARVPCRGGCGVLVWMHTAGRSGYCPTCLGEKRRVVRHGTESEYNRGCRCYECLTAANAARQRRRLANAEAARTYNREYKQRRASRAQRERASESEAA